ncbi:gamma-glutamylaminecyclotransferase-like [Mercenaria mercenaria]|uniref:gamma-glutamylaminecyclotransferase-like n=1 Tax=Mercenaria mercenaria TaxID=6596 RepID=UPI00234EED72|nr:gamma-glutamylaminecyclotransferase-like [Mercenaria mercenaria]
MTVLIFVYGTLKSGLPNHHLIENKTDGLCISRGTATTEEKFPLVTATRYNVPFMLYAPGKGHNIEGELYEVDETRLKSLDKLEAHPHLYERRDIIVTKSAGREGSENAIKVQSYFLVKYRPLLLDMPMLKNYDGQGFVIPEERKEMKHWWSEVHMDYDDA